MQLSLLETKHGSAAKANPYDTKDCQTKQSTGHGFGGGIVLGAGSWGKVLGKWGCIGFRDGKLGVDQVGAPFGAPRSLGLGFGVFEWSLTWDGFDGWGRRRE